MNQSDLKTSQFCSQISIQAGEFLVGTATRTRAYLLLEYSGAWGDKAYEESNLPAETREYLNTLMKSMPDVKTLLIKQDSTGNRDSFYLYVAVMENPPRLYQYRITSYQSILSLDLAGLIQGTTADSASLRKEPLFLVCTNGRRDACCAKFGLSVYEALAKTMGDSVWQCSHVGGHRFAPNMLCFPDGLLYGRLGAENVSDIAQAFADGYLDVISYRGRIAYDPPVQAADFFLRRQTGELRLGNYHLKDVQFLADEQWLIRFSEKHRPREHTLVIGRIKSDDQVFESCRLDKAIPLAKYVMINYSVS
jgi:hypothetical protein